jgi:hypothetical protein
VARRRWLGNPAMALGWVVRAPVRAMRPGSPKRRAPVGWPPGSRAVPPARPARWREHSPGDTSMVSSRWLAREPLVAAGRGCPADAGSRGRWAGAHGRPPSARPCFRDCLLRECWSKTLMVTSTPRVPSLVEKVPWCRCRHAGRRSADLVGRPSQRLSLPVAATNARARRGRGPRSWRETSTCPSDAPPRTRRPGRPG